MEIDLLRCRIHWILTTTILGQVDTEHYRRYWICLDLKIISFSSWICVLFITFQRGFNELFGSGLIKSTRYSSLLSINCDTDATCTMDLDKILVLSSAIQRCVDSVQSFLNGFVRVDWPSSLVNVIPQDQDEVTFTISHLDKLIESRYTSDVSCTRKAMP